jgi:hypothetical protein
MRVVRVDDLTPQVPHLDADRSVREDATSNERVERSIAIGGHPAGGQILWIDAVQELSVQVIVRCQASFVECDTLYGLSEEESKDHTEKEEDQEAGSGEAPRERQV